MQKRTPGLIKIGQIWHIEKQVRGTRLRESTGTSDLAEAERYLAHRLKRLRELQLYGNAPKIPFREMANRYYKSLPEHQQRRVQLHLLALDPWIAQVPIDEVGMLQLQPYTDYRLGTLSDEDRALIPPGLPWPPKRIVSPKTVKLSLEVVRRVLRLCASDYQNDLGQPYLKAAPAIRMPSLNGQQRPPEPMSRSQEQRLLDQLPPHLHAMCLFKVNTGCREQEVCRLRWDYERPIPELNRSVFVVPAMDEKGSLVKNGTPRLVVLNDIAWEVIEKQRGRHPTHVFVYETSSGERHPVQKINNTAWKSARARAHLTLRVHDLKHTFGARLRAAGVSFEDRQTLLGHRGREITTHYSAADLHALLQAANRVCTEAETPTLLVLATGTLVR